MNLLLDTHILIWYIEGNPSLNQPMLDLIEATENDLYISIASLWEMAIKIGKGKLNLGIEFHELENLLNQLEIKILSIVFSDTETYHRLPFHHNDPFDRIIISQAISQNISLMSADHQFSAYAIHNIWE
jgi:PIN domain nuclease of toxin-antitoxin system